MILTIGLEMLAKEITNQIGNFSSMRLKGKMSGIQQVDSRVRKITLIRRGTGGDKDRIIFTPNH